MKSILKSTLLIFSISFYLVSCSQEKKTDVNQVIEKFKIQYAPDKRVALWDIQWDGKNLTGETNLKMPLNSFLTSLDSAGVEYQNQIKLFPDGELEGKEYAIVTISVGNIRSEPKHSAELATQATMGTPLQVLKKQDTWYLIQTPEGYISWIDAAGITLMTEQEINAWYQKEKAVFIPLFGHVFASESETEIVSDLVAGNILIAQNEFQNHLEILLPDGRSGFVRKDQMMPYEEWLASRETSPDKLIQTAKSMMGVPYLWGGTSVKGVDCSGFTKTIFFLNGEIIPRDASQQVHEGEEIDVNRNWENLEVGDLLFFGSKATADSKERVVHVGMWIGSNSFIHSRGRVRISSFDPASPDYDEYELNRYLRTKRIIGKESKNIKNVEGLFESIPNS
ncbi:cell wall-associated hydrolase, invasion-associated protein [Belliella baltica DSM 15883]|uniref:Cell wall-associated hydrolase, invasion-associated protein n=1 Tax=Belliella baltica (strain DSM 15883 / CIP 108006 / LMG 21964 / BA134) TaxID=866536 RepID=I3Z9N7_BELBD|nr:C40 family peptidase [Belliella baltica]AFL85955.1 cell wall-associated hydrolase, invasion-associated protein [Belliella baltica DSM 15883]